MAEICAGAAAGIALLVSAGWLSGARFLAGQWATYVPMAPSSALVFLLLSGALFCLAHWPGLRLSRLFTLCAVGVAFLIGLLVLGQFFTGVDLGVEYVLSRTNEFMGSTPVGRMSPLTAVAFLLESSSFVFLIMRGWRNALVVAALLTTVAAAINAVVLVGYAFGAPLLYGGTMIPVALPTAIAFLLIAAGQFYIALPGIPSLRSWSGTTMRGMLLRAFLPAMLLLILLDGWVDIRFEPVLVLNQALWSSLKSMLAAILIVIITSWIARRSGSELELAQETLTESEEKFRSVFENSPLGKSLTGLDRSLHVNRAFCEILGYSEEELNTRNWEEVTHPDDIQKSLDANQALLEGRISRAHFEKRYIHKNGSIVWTDLTTAIQRDESGKPLYFITSINDITERKQVEEALRIADANYQSLFDHSTVGIYQSTPQGGYLNVNPAMAHIFGYASPEEMIRGVSNIGQQSYVEPDARSKFERLMSEDGQVRELTGRARRRDGQIIWVQENARAVTAADGSVRYYEGFVTDITERKRAQEELQHSAERYRAVTESANDAIISADSAGYIIDWNHGAKTMFGYPAAEVVGQPLTLIMPEVYVDAHLAGMARLRASGAPTIIGKTIELEGRCLDGSIFPIEFSLSDWTQADDRFYTAIIRDITERRRAGAERASLAAIVDSSDDAIIGKTLEGVITSWNSGAQRLYGYSAEEVIGQPFSLLVPPDRLEELWENLFLLERGERVEHLETARVGKDGVRLDVSVSISPIKDAAGRVVSAASISRDITGRKRAQEELRQAKEALESINTELQLSLAREKTLARTDGLTGLCNRSYFIELATRELHTAVRHQRPFTILMIDVDHFKRINDNLGHAAGDEVLALIARKALAHLRAADVLARYGGDEFILLLPETTAQQSLAVAERVRADVEATVIRNVIHRPAVTLSMGVAERRSQGRSQAMDETLEEIIHRADEALYRAKAEGRNRVVVLKEDDVLMPKSRPDAVA